MCRPCPASSRGPTTAPVETRPNGRIQEPGSVVSRSPRAGHSGCGQNRSHSSTETIIPRSTHAFRPGNFDTGRKTTPFPRSDRATASSAERSPRRSRRGESFSNVTESCTFPNRGRDARLVSGLRMAGSRRPREEDRIGSEKAIASLGGRSHQCGTGTGRDVHRQRRTIPAGAVESAATHPSRADSRLPKDPNGSGQSKMRWARKAEAVAFGCGEEGSGTHWVGPYERARTRVIQRAVTGSCAATRSRGSGPDRSSRPIATRNPCAVRSAEPRPRRKAVSSAGRTSSDGRGEKDQVAIGRTRSAPPGSTPVDTSREGQRFRPP